MAAPRGTVGEITLHVKYTHEQISEILRNKAKEDLKVHTGGKEPTGTSSIKFTGEEQGTDFHISAAIDFSPM